MNASPQLGAPEPCSILIWVSRRCQGLAADSLPLVASCRLLSTCSVVPEGLTQLSALTSLCLERNYIRHLPPSLSCLRSLAALRCGVCVCVCVFGVVVVGCGKQHSARKCSSGSQRGVS